MKVQKEESERLTFDTFAFHPHHKALLITTVLTSVALSFVDEAGSVLPTGVGQLLPHRTFEKSLATFATAKKAVCTVLVQSKVYMVH